ncbi:zinc finger protein 34 isoform X3 [Frieseomelitta varia]|uniref:zinc finger protein 34 isoform X3 n=1 Tax=Frieseomelitta varia TaxID=561572 RepID=UPI001CB6A3F5|nr:zinc finger protein 34 isoform X3 [Frieseomelitta varia]
MGLMMSILIGCVGMLELFACLRHVADSLVIRINQPVTPCLSYHEPNDNMSTHDSICSYSHSTDVNLPRGAKHKLENLHEYSLRIRTELRRLDKSFDYSRPLSECSIKDFLLPARASPDSRLSPDFEYLVRASSDLRDDKEIRYERETSYEDAAENWRVESSSRDRPLSVIAPPEPERYVRVPTPIPFSVDDELSSSGASSDVGTSFDNDSGNEAPTMRSFESIPLIRRYKTPSEGGSSIDESDDNDRHARRSRKPKIGKSHSKSPESPKSGEPGIEAIADRSRSSENLREIELESTEKLDAIQTGEIQGESSARGTSQRKKIKSSSTIVRKPTRLKSKDAQVSKSAENLTARKSKKHRDPQRRKSDISVQTSSHLRDEWTNTSPPPSSPMSSLSRSESRRSVSVQVQTNFEDLEQLAPPCLDASTELLESSAVGLSESRRDLTSRDRFGRRRTFKNRRFGSGSRDKADDDDDYSMSNATRLVERRKDEARLLKISSFEEADDEDYQRIRDILTEADSRECNERERRKGSRTASSFEDEEYWDAEDLIFSGEYTKAMNKDWHSGHFCCWQCDESLTGQRYVLRDEHPYCIKCYESVFANGCEECNKIIGIDSKDLSYKDKHWHEACFLCNRCRVSLVDKQFGSKVDKIYCGNCYDAQFASRCDGCGEIFRAGTKKMEYKTRQWHEKCFCCVVCKNPIGTKSFIPREQEIYCAACYEDKFATRCVKCNKIITSGGVTYKNEPWHRDCFTCSNCNNSLAGQRFTSRNDKPYCAECFGELFAKRCTACSKPITGIGGTRFISFEDRHWHNDCFICAGCKTSLVGRGFITDGEDIICPDCAKMKVM